MALAIELQPFFNIESHGNSSSVRMDDFRGMLNYLRQLAFGTSKVYILAEEMDTIIQKYNALFHSIVEYKLEQCHELKPIINVCACEPL
jgi:hypothetical protein